MSAALAHTTFQHEAVLYGGLEDLLADAVPFVREGLALRLVMRLG